MREYEQVQVVDVNNGNRFVTYVIKGKENSGVICLNGAAARQVSVGDKVIIMSYGILEKTDVDHKPTVVLVDVSNRISGVYNYEQEGSLINV
jgi:aspartate 1-decarboxylase